MPNLNAIRFDCSTQKHDSISDVVPESYQIQDFLKQRNNSTRGNAIPSKYINVIYEFCLARQKHDVLIAAVPESCSTAELIELNSKV